MGLHCESKSSFQEAICKKFPTLFSSHTDDDRSAAKFNLFILNNGVIALDLKRRLFLIYSAIYFLLYETVKHYVPAEVLRGVRGGVGG